VIIIIIIIITIIIIVYRRCWKVKHIIGRVDLENAIIKARTMLGKIIRGKERRAGNPMEE
jgi:hypothetical protein